MDRTMNVGIIGCGNISDAYLKAAAVFSGIRIAACSDINITAAESKAREYGISAAPVDVLLSDDTIDIILNLTTPQAHTEVNLKALQAGKHVHCEKPLAIDREDGRKVIDLAKEKGLMIGCAPDTFLGGGIQTCRKLIDDDKIGRIVAGTAFMMCHGHESWHPNPGFYYLKGGGPMFDMGPYYLTALVNLIGPIKSISAMSAMTFKERIATSKEQNGVVLPVEIPTHITGILEFHNGALVTLAMSFDVWRHSNHNIELHGEKGSLQVPDPNCFDGAVRIARPGDDDWQEVPLTHGYTDNMRVIGAADMASAIRNKRRNRCSGELAYHVLDVMQAFDESSIQGRRIVLEGTCEQPAALPTGLADGELD
ncbi:Gfo/Idh/MocA family oxidoreductase [Candidatus Sumerlaeota bacterium]|nr:Gfo/Idh/MocA family oxidoreductase [Candidatus Sumerlaeota bacterium]